MRTSILSLIINKIKTYYYLVKQTAWKLILKIITIIWKNVLRNLLHGYYEYEKIYVAIP